MVENTIPLTTQLVMRMNNKMNKRGASLVSIKLHFPGSKVYMDNFNFVNDLVSCDLASDLV